MGTPNRTQAATSSDGGATWSTPADLSATNAVIGNASIVGSADGQRLTAVWIQQDPIQARVFMSQSSNGGATWSSAAAISNFGTTIPYAAASTDGTTVVVVWTEQGIAEAPVYYSRWTAGTDAWTSPALVSPADEYAGQAAVTPLCPAAISQFSSLNVGAHLKSRCIRSVRLPAVGAQPLCC